MSVYMVIGTSELHWDEKEYDDEENDSRFKNKDMIARVRMFFGTPKEPEYPYGETSVDEDFLLPDGFNHFTDYPVIENALKEKIEARMAEIQNNVGHVESELVPNQREQVHNDHRISVPGPISGAAI